MPALLRPLHFVALSLFLLASILPDARSWAQSPPRFAFTFGSRGHGNSQFSDPRRVGVDRNGHVYVSDTDNERVQEFTKSGQFIRIIHPGSRIPEGIAFDDLGYIYITDVWGGSIIKCEPSGSVVARWGSEGSGDEQFMWPYTVVVDGSVLYVGDRGNNRIQTLSTSGEFLGHWSGHSSGRLGFAPLALAIDPYGNLLVSVVDRVQRYTTAGVFLGEFGEFSQASGIAVDPAGAIFVSDAYRNRIIEFDHSGKYVLEWGDEGAAPGQLSLPTDVAVNSSEGLLYVCDRRNDRIQAFSLRADEESPLITCPQALTIGCEHACADDPALAAFLGGATATDNADPNPVITHDAPTCFPLGVTEVTFTATDAAGNSGTCATSVTVVDRDPPDMTAFPSRRLLWPPNNKMVPIQVEVVVQDNCDPAPTFVLNEIQVLEDGRPLPVNQAKHDYDGADVGTKDTAFRLRAQRSGGTERRYLVIFVSADVTGNAAADTVSVFVPANRAGATLRPAAASLDDATDVGRMGAPPPDLTMDAIRIARSGAPARISLGVPEESEIRLEVLDLQGRLVSALDLGRYPPGWHTLTWPPQAAGRDLAFGIYYLRATDGRQVATGRVLVLR